MTQQGPFVPYNAERDYKISRQLLDNLLGNDDDDGFVHYVASIYDEVVLCGLDGKVMIGPKDKVTCPNCLEKLKEN